MKTQEINWKRMEADLTRREELEKKLSELYIRRAGREKHVSRIIPEYSAEWQYDPGVKGSDRKGEEKMNSAEMMLLVAERNDLKASEARCRELVGWKIEQMHEEGAADEVLEGLREGIHGIGFRLDQMDEAAITGQRIIRQTGHIKRCLDQALKFRMGSGGLSEPLRAALHAVELMKPMLERFYTLLGEPCIAQNLYQKIRDCQIAGSDWMWEQFDYDIIGLITRLFHRPDMQRFSEVEVELLDVRFRVYNAMSRVTEERSRATGDLQRMARMVALDVDLSGETEQQAIA